MEQSGALVKPYRYESGKEGGLVLGHVLWTPKMCFPLSCTNMLVLLHMVFGLESAGEEYCTRVAFV